MWQEDEGVGAEGGWVVPTWTGWEDFPLSRRREDLTLIGDGRRPGKHVSDSIRRMKVEMGENVGGIPGEAPWLRPQIGFLFEFALEVMAATGCRYDEALAVALKRHLAADRTNVEKQLRLVYDDIHGTPDGLDLDNRCMESYKCTWRSSRGSEDLTFFLEKFWTWDLQERAYLKMYNETHEEKVYSCRWIVLFVCGDYRRPIGPRCQTTMVTWSPEEIDRAWESIVAHAEEEE